MDKKDLILLGEASVIGAFTGLGLSFTALSPLVIGGIIAAIPIILLTACFIYDRVKQGKLFKQGLFWTSVVGVAGIAIGVGVGVGLAAAATAIFPGAMLGMGSAALTGAAIGAIVPIVTLLTLDYIIGSIAGKVGEYIISPIIESFSSKEKEV